MAKQRFVYFDYFRAIAILLIILGHSWGEWQPDQPVESMFTNLAFGNTALFVFISGFFFHAVFYKRFVYHDFMRKKSVAILVPYATMMLLFIAYHFMVMGGTVTFPIELSNDATWQSWLAAFARLITGHGPMALWYIPFAMLLFALSPLFIRFIESRKHTAIGLTVVFFIVSMLVHRPYMVVNPIHSLVYFLPFYMLGILYSQHRSHIDAWIKHNLMLLSLLLVTILIWMNWQQQIASPTRLNPFEYHGFDWMVPLKVVMIFWLLALLKKIEHIHMPIFHYLASISFGLFFLHAWPLEFLWITNLQSTGFLTVMTTFIVVTISCVVSVEMVRAVLKSKSKFVIGV